MLQKSVIQEIASLIQARKNCQKSGNHEWFDRHTDTLHLIEKEHLPSGAGIDNGTTIDFDNSTDTKIILHTAYHHMNSNGYYDGWTDHTIIIRPRFDGLDIDIKGRNRNDIKEYLHEVFSDALQRDW